jgi:hypothetical protein
MHTEAYTRAVLAERVREREIAMRNHQLRCSEPARSPRTIRLRFFRLPRRLRTRRAGAYLT